MKKIRIAVLAVVVVAVLAPVGWVVFERFDRADKIKNAKKACAELDVVTPGATVPAGFTLPAGQKLLRVQTQGKTSVVFASIDGTRNDLVRIRDATVEALKSQGYRLTQTDQEPTYEADAALSRGGVDDSVNVRPLCSGKVVVRYTLH